MERWEEALTDYTDIIRISPQDEDAHYERAMVRLILADTTGARRELELIDSFNPHSAKARLGMAYVYKTTGDYGLAADLYDALIEANPKSYSLYMQRAEVYYLSGRLGAAEGDINRSIALYDKDPMTYLLRGRIRYARRDKKGAKADVDRALVLGLDPQIADDLIKKCK
jgi:tetratricopeptide (TPR) repeat protein